MNQSKGHQQLVKNRALQWYYQRTGDITKNFKRMGQKKWLFTYVGYGEWWIGRSSPSQKHSSSAKSSKTIWEYVLLYPKRSMVVVALELQLLFKNQESGISHFVVLLLSSGKLKMNRNATIMHNNDPKHTFDSTNKRLNNKKITFWTLRARAQTN